MSSPGRPESQFRSAQHEGTRAFGPVRWGFWGAGAIAHRVASDLCRVDGAQALAVASRSVESARAFAGVHRLPRVHASLEAMLDDAEIDVVYVATPAHRHAHDAIVCLRRGKAVLCEKPFALNEAQVIEMIAEARRAGRFCMEAMWMQFIPAVQAVRELVRSGAIGRVRMLAGDFAYPTAFDPASPMFVPELGGGALLDRGVYLVALAQSLLGEAVSVRANAQLTSTGVDEHSAYQMQYADGATAQLWAGFTVRGSNSVVIVGEKGQIRLHEPFYSAHRFSVSHDAPAQASPAGGAVADDGLAARIKRALAQQGVHRRIDWLRAAWRHVGSRSMPFAGNGYQFELDEVTRCLRAGRVESAVMPLADSLAVARTMDRLRACWQPSAHPADPARPVAQGAAAP